MAGAPIRLAKKFILELVDRLPVGSSLSIVTASRVASVELDGHVVSDATQRHLESVVLPRIWASDVTNLDAGIESAYTVAFRHYRADYLNRVVLVSDGAANARVLAIDTISKQAEDTDRQGVYLIGLGLGEGFNDQLMNEFTDRERGAYLFIDSEAEILRATLPARLVTALDLAVRDVRLKMTLPAGWSISEFHGEQITAHAEEVTPQYLSSEDQMIYHLAVTGRRDAADDIFEFEAEFAPLRGARQTLISRLSVEAMLSESREILKGDTITEYAEMLKEIAWPLDTNRETNTAHFEGAYATVAEANSRLEDPDLSAILELLTIYRRTVRDGEQLVDSRDRSSDEPAAVMGIDPATVREVGVSGPHPSAAIGAREKLLQSNRLVPMEGYQFLLLSSGAVGTASPAGSGELGAPASPDPVPEFHGSKRATKSASEVFGLHQIHFDLTAPMWARSFSFDLNFFSAEYPDYINQDFNDTFYAIIEAQSTNNGATTNIAFDSDGRSIEVDNNYFQQPFHPIPNTGTGFDYHGSTGWLRTSWPIQGGEEFRITFSIHDEGDAIYDSLAVLDNFRWYAREGVGTTDPLN